MYSSPTWLYNVITAAAPVSKSYCTLSTKKILMRIYVTAVTATSGQLSKVLYHICRWLHVQTRTIIWTHLEQNECKLRCEGGNHNLIESVISQRDSLIFQKNEKTCSKRFKINFMTCLPWVCKCKVVLLQISSPLKNYSVFI